MDQGRLWGQASSSKLGVQRGQIALQTQFSASAQLSLAGKAHAILGGLKKSGFQKHHCNFASPDQGHYQRQGTLLPGGFQFLPPRCTWLAFGTSTLSLKWFWSHSSEPKWLTNHVISNGCSFSAQPMAQDDRNDQTVEAATVRSWSFCDHLGYPGNLGWTHCQAIFGAKMCNKNCRFQILPI